MNKIVIMLIKSPIFCQMAMGMHWAAHSNFRLFWVFPSRYFLLLCVLITIASGLTRSVWLPGALLGPLSTHTTSARHMLTAAMTSTSSQQSLWPFLLTHNWFCQFTIASIPSPNYVISLQLCNFAASPHGPPYSGRTFMPIEQGVGRWRNWSISRQEYHCRSQNSCCFPSINQHFSGCCTHSVTFWVQKPFVLFICPALKLFFKEIYWFLTHCNQKSFLAFTFRLWKAQMLSFILKVCLYRIPKWFQYVSVCGSNAIKPDRWTVSTEPGSWHDHLPQAPVSVRRRPLDQPTVYMLYSSLIGWKVRPLSVHFITHVTLTLWHSWS